ncbi:nucleotide disphospho-sugar-binding domain-containing protein [Micromonospora sp. DT81.3]|uniref:nucleotide disphospho-sugar-binding domain-containing protein n=1 Tax=Micromonospora sp. DT81.3 TaxID=3416523 RepID=UPI003CF7A414
MRVLILTFGTRGDVDPFIALADRLASDGHSAVLAAPEPYRGAVSPAVRFEAMATEMHRVMRAGMADLGGPSQALGLAREMFAAMDESLGEQWNIAQRVDPTVIVGHPKALGGIHIAERLSVPFVSSLPLPFLTPTTAFPIPFVARPLPGPVNRATYQFNRITALAYGGMVNRFRQSLLGLPRMSRHSDYLRTLDGDHASVLYPFSRHVVAVPADYPARVHVTGYWFTATATTWTAPPRLVDFLESDQPVVYVGFGSMGFGAKAAQRSRVVLDALRSVGVRAVVATGWGGLAAESGNDILVVDDVPHEWLFPRVSAVVHHGGSGTTAAGLRWGRPTLICPILGDQAFWGRRVNELGAGPRPLSLRRATSSSLADRIVDLTSHESYRTQAAVVEDGIRAEDGTGEAVKLLEQIESASSSRRVAAASSASNVHLGRRSSGQAHRRSSPAVRRRDPHTDSMVRPQLFSTSAGVVEIVHLPGERPGVLFFPGGHCRAATDCGWSLYTALGYEVVSFSRPGYGGTRVGRLTAAEFTPLVGEVCEELGISTVAASVGVSFGGLQAVHVAAGQGSTAQRLILHSCAPSSPRYPDSMPEALLGPVLFSPVLEGVVWRAVRASIRSDEGLRMMMSPLSNLRASEWWERMDEANRDEARNLFRSMGSDAGFVTDLRQGHAREAELRRRAMSRVHCPTLVTASRHDGGVSFAHAEDFARVVPDSSLVELDSPTHLFWIGNAGVQLLAIIASFMGRPVSV